MAGLADDVYPLGLRVLRALQCFGLGPVRGSFGLKIELEGLGA